MSNADRWLPLLILCEMSKYMQDVTRVLNTQGVIQQL